MECSRYQFKLPIVVEMLTNRLRIFRGIIERIPRAADIFRLFQRWLTVQFEALGHADAKTMAAHLLARTQGVAVLASAFHDEDFLRRETVELIDWLDAIAPARPN